jgi:hypothetical protein
MSECCFECVMCSEHYPSFKDTCDLDEHEISDVEHECCEHFAKSDD